MKELAFINPELIVYSDETGIDDNEVSSMGWSQRGTRCVAAKRSERKARYNIYAALHNGNIFAPYSPDLNPIEHYWATIKRAIRAKAQEVNEFLDACETVLHELCISY